MSNTRSVGNKPGGLRRLPELWQGRKLTKGKQSPLSFSACAKLADNNTPVFQPMVVSVGKMKGNAFHFKFSF